jgi:hypothetical protein
VTRNKHRFVVLLFASLTAPSLSAPGAAAFPHVVQPGDTLAKIAERYYGKIQLERVLSTANALDGARAGVLAPGMLLEIPALSYVTVGADDTWKSLAQQHLGNEGRSILLAEINGQKPWIDPELGQIVRLPYNLTWRASGEESLATLAYRFLGSTKHAYRLVTYNDLDEDGPEKGQILLLPLSDLSLSVQGQAAARLAAARLIEQGESERYLRQQTSDQALREVALDVRGGRYLASLEKGVRLLEAGQLPEPSRAEVHRLLLETFVALGAVAAARTSCQSYLDTVEVPNLDPLLVSPKILAACRGLSKATTASTAPAPVRKDSHDFEEDSDP